MPKLPVPGPNDAVVQCLIAPLSAIRARTLKFESCRRAIAFRERARLRALIPDPGRALRCRRRPIRASHNGETLLAAIVSEFRDNAGALARFWELRRGYQGDIIGSVDAVGPPYFLWLGSAFVFRRPER